MAIHKTVHLLAQHERYKIVQVNNNTIYWDYILHTRNLYRQYFGITDIINHTTHYAFMRKYGHSYIVIIDLQESTKFIDKCVGFAGVVNNDIRIAVHPDYHRKGIGQMLLQDIMAKYPLATAKIRTDNTASLALFESCGFKTNNVKYYILER